MNDNWRHDAACLGMNPDLFFPNEGENAQAPLAVCARCPVRTECATEHLDEHHGIFGGLTPRQRQTIRLRNPRIPPRIHHGTVGGYQAHRRRGEPPCLACITEQSAYAQRAKVERRLHLVIDNTHGGTGPPATHNANVTVA